MKLIKREILTEFFDNEYAAFLCITLPNMWYPDEKLENTILYNCYI